MAITIYCKCVDANKYCPLSMHLRTLYDVYYFYISDHKHSKTLSYINHVGIFK